MKPRLLLCLCAAAVLCAAPALSQSKPAPVPPFTAVKELGEYLATSGIDLRIRLYQSYFASPDINRGATELIASRFEADLAASTAFVRKDLADRALKAVRTPPTGTRKVAASGTASPAASGTTSPKTETYAADLAGFQAILRALAAQDDTAAQYYTALPLGAAGGASFDAVDLGGRRAAVLLRIAAAVKPKLSAAGKRILVTELGRWPWRLGNKDYDVQALRDCARLFSDASLDLFTAVETSYGSFDALDWKAFAAAKPTDDEYALLFAGLLRFTKGVGVTSRLTDLELRQGTAWEAARATALALRQSKAVRARAIANLLAFLSSGKPADASGLAEPIASAAKEPDDWAAFSVYRIAAARGEKLSDESLLPCLDPKRPSLAAAVIEDRWAAEYLDEARMTAYTDPSLAVSTAFETAALKVLPVLARAPAERHFIPPMAAVILLGRSKYVDQVAFLMDCPNPAVREMMAETLLRFADPRFYGYFIRRLYDENQNVRYLCIRGLGAIRDSRAVEPLARILNDPKEREWIRAACAEALGSIGDRRCIQIFTSYLMVPRGAEGSSLSLRLYAAQYLGQKKEKTAVDALIANLDPAEENRLNFACLEALGRINDPSGFAKLLPVFSKAWKTWSAPPDGGTGDNFYAAMWALFPYKADGLLQIALEAFDAMKGAYSDGAFAAAYYLVRNAKEPKEEWRAWCTSNRGRFFESPWRVYEYAVMLEKSWDAETLLFLAGRMDGLDVSTQSWLLSGMIQKPSLAFLPFLPKVRDSESASVRGWTAHLADSLARLLPRPQTEEGVRAAAELAALLDGWNKEEKDGTAASWLAAARRNLESYRKANP